MAFGRKKRNEDEQEGQQPEGVVQETAAGSEAGAPGSSPGPGDVGSTEETRETGDVAVADERATAAAPPAVESPEPAAQEPAAREGSSAAPGGDLGEATASAGDPAAAGVDAEGPGAGHVGDTSTREQPSPTASRAAGEATPSDPQTAGSVASSPEPAAVPTASEPVAGTAGAGAGAGDDGGSTAGATAAQAQTLVEERPEVLVAGAFAAGLVLAKVLAALGGKR